MAKRKQDTQAIAPELPAVENTDFNPSEFEAASEPNDVARQIVTEVAESTRMPDEARDQPSTRVTATAAEPARYADPFPRHTVRWPDDGYEIAIQESGSRNTIEIQFGDGSREAQPKAFSEIKARLKEEGFRWNGTRAWAKELAPVVGSQNDKLRARDDNHRTRARVEDIVFPAVIAMEEAVRGEIPFTEETRERFNKGAAVQSR